MKKVFLILITVFILLNQRCDFFDARLKLSNQSNETITYYLNKDTLTGDWINNYVKPSNITSDNKVFFYKDFIPAKSIGHLTAPGGGEWDMVLKNDFKDSTVYLFVFDSLELVRYVLDTSMNKEVKYIRYDLNLKTLQESNWIIFHK